MSFKDLWDFFLSFLPCSCLLVHYPGTGIIDFTVNKLHNNLWVDSNQILSVNINVYLSLKQNSTIFVFSCHRFDCWISLSSRGILCCNGWLTHCVLLKVDTKVSKDTPLTRPLFPLINFVICPFFQWRRGKLTFFASTVSPIETFWRWGWSLWRSHWCLSCNARIYSL